MPMFEVDEGEVQKILAMKVPKHPKTTFDNEEFRDLIARSFSITVEEKQEILLSAGTLEQAAVDSLLRVLREEQAGMADINRRAEKARRAKLRLVE